MMSAALPLVQGRIFSMGIMGTGPGAHAHWGARASGGPA